MTPRPRRGDIFACPIERCAQRIRATGHELAIFCDGRGKHRPATMRPVATAKAAARTHKTA